MANYTAEDRAKAAELYQQVGATEAARQIGCSRRTIFNWLGDDIARAHAEKTKAATEASRVRSEALREQIKVDLLETVLDLLSRLKEPYYEYDQKGNRSIYHVPPAQASQQMMTAVGIAIDKFRIEAGEVTSRKGKVFSGESDADRELARMVDEFRRQSIGPMPEHEALDGAAPPL